MRLTIAILFVLGVILTFGAMNASPAHCVWCPTYKCYARCSRDCACVSTDFGGGRCVSIQAIPEGAEVLP